jgi:prepilin-type N-terminal cleavage/methylation domain-containing protein
MKILKYFSFEKKDPILVPIRDCYRKGFTLLEILMVMSIMVIISAVSVGAFFNLREKNLIQKDADSIVSMIEKAKSMSSNRKNDSSYGVKFSSSTVTIFSGQNFTSGNVISKYDLEKLVVISAVSLSSNTLELGFNKITGNPNATGTVTLITPSYSRVVTIFGTGIIEMK